MAESAKKGRGEVKSVLLNLLLAALYSFSVTWAVAEPPAKPTLGVDRPGLYLPLLEGKRVGLVVNQASLSGGAHTIDILRGQGVNVIKLFALEHGIRGEGGAGEGIPDSIDPVSGLPIVSLYGTHYKPTPAMLADIDVVVYDIQDVGVRFYTYISSLGLIMEAAAENSRHVLVLDRPNPNGDYVEGPLMKAPNISFLGAFPIPVVYGLTVGELALMIHAEGWKRTQGLRMDVVPMAGYRRDAIYGTEGMPSSGLRTLNAIRVYPSLALFEPTIMSVGKGTDHPYTQYGIPDERIGPHSFVPRSLRPGHHPLYEGRVCYGEEYLTLPAEQVPRFTTDMFTSALTKVKRRPFVNDQKFLRLLVGDQSSVQMMLKGAPYGEIRRRFARELEVFLERRQRYFIY